MSARHQEIRLNGSFPLRFTIVEDLKYPPHWHEHFEVIYIIDGSIKAVIGNNAYEMQKEDILFISPACVHYFEAFGAKGSKVLVIRYSRLFLQNIWIDRKNEAKFFELFERNTVFHRAGTSAAYKPEKRIENIIDEFKSKKGFYREMVKAEMLLLLAGLHINTALISVRRTEGEKNVADLLRINGVFEYIDKNYTGKITLAEAADSVNLSAYYFDRLFKKTTGMSFGKYLTSYRVVKSEWYLANTACNVTEAAFKAGFNSIQTFNRVFMKTHGCTPSQFKAKQ